MNPTDPTKSESTQPYRTTRAAQQVRRLITLGDDRYPVLETTHADGSRQLTAPFRCASCKTPHASQYEADVCCAANELQTGDVIEILARELGRRLNHSR